MSRALEGLSSLPGGVHAVVALGMVVGIVLWLAGQRLLKPLLITGLVTLGGLVGGLVIPSATWGASFSSAQAIGIGAIAGLLIGLLLYRSAMAVGFGVVMGAAFPLIAASVLQFYPIAESSSPQRPSAWSLPAEEGWERISTAVPAPEIASARHAVRLIAASWMDEGAATQERATPIERPRSTASASAAASPSTPDRFIPPQLRPAAERIGEAWSTASARAREEWTALPDAHRAVIALAGIVGLAGGVVAGLVLPAWAGSAVSALFGAAIWLPCFVWLSNAFSAPWRTWLDRSPAGWLAIWTGVALAGMVFQWRTMARRKAATAVPAAAASAA